LEQICQEFKEQHVATNIKFEKQKQTLTAQIQDWKGQYETIKVKLSEPNSILPFRMNNRLKELKELLLDNTLLKVQNQALGDKTPSGRSGGKPFNSSWKS
jgi:hypothetical protein